MNVARTIAEVRAHPRHGSVGLVPTMGALHAGHVALFEAARAECDTVIASLFVNPAQFSEDADLAAYPRDEEADAAVAAEAGVDLLFAPSVEEIYPPGFSTWIDPGEEGLEAEFRPGHFRGVATVCLKLFTIVRPDVAYFGQKDAQQAAVIRRMVRDLDFPVRIEVLPTVREPDGLAMSSRNAYLGAEDRKRAAAISRALRAAAEGAHSESLVAGLEAARRELAEAGIEPEYLEARDAEELEPVTALNGRPVLLAVAARVGGARLIDNVLIEP